MVLWWKIEDTDLNIPLLLHLHRSQVLALNSAKQSHQFTRFTDCSENVSLVSLSSLIHYNLCHARNLTKRALLSDLPQVWLQYKVSQADSGTMARHYEGDRWQVWHQRTHLLPLPKMAPYVQHFLFPHQFWLHHHPAACFRPLAQRTCECELQRPGVTDRSCKWKFPPSTTPQLRR